jgi:hypothetical protein
MIRRPDHELHDICRLDPVDLYRSGAETVNQELAHPHPARCARSRRQSADRIQMRIESIEFVLNRLRDQPPAVPKYGLHHAIPAEGVRAPGAQRSRCVDKGLNSCIPADALSRNDAPATRQWNEAEPAAWSSSARNARRCGGRHEQSPDNNGDPANSRHTRRRFDSEHSI